MRGGRTGHPGLFRTYGRERRSSFNFHLHGLEHLLGPQQHFSARTPENKREPGAGTVVLRRTEDVADAEFQQNLLNTWYPARLVKTGDLPDPSTGEGKESKIRGAGTRDRGE